MAKEKTYIVLKDFTLERKYYVGQPITLSDDKVIKKLLTNNIIK